MGKKPTQRPTSKTPSPSSPSNLGNIFPNDKQFSEKFRQALAERISAALELSGFDGLEDLAQRSGVPRRTLANYVAAESTPNAEYLMRLAVATGVNAGWLLTGDGSPQPAVLPESSDGRTRIAAANRELLALVAQLGRTLAVMAPLLTPAEREEMAKALALLSEHLQPPA